MVIKLGKHEVELYDGIEGMPIVRFHRYQKMLLLDAGVGGDLSALDARIERVNAYLAQKDTDKARKEIENLRLSVFFIQNNINPRHRAFACLVKRIDRKQYDGAEDEQIDAILRELSDVPVAEIEQELNSVKKKIEADLILYFPRLFGDAGEKEYYELLRRRTVRVLDGIINGESDPEKSAEELTIKILLYINPRKYAGSEGMEVQYDKQFENICLSLSEQLNIRPKTMAVFEFYSAFELIRDRAREMQKQVKRQR